MFRRFPGQKLSKVVTAAGRCPRLHGVEHVEHEVRRRHALGPRDDVRDVRVVAPDHVEAAAAGRKPLPLWLAWLPYGLIALLLVAEGSGGVHHRERARPARRGVRDDLT